MKTIEIPGREIPRDGEITRDTAADLGLPGTAFLVCNTRDVEARAQAGRGVGAGERVQGSDLRLTPRAKGRTEAVVSDRFAVTRPAFPRHCEREPKQSRLGTSLDCFAALAMTTCCWLGLTKSKARATIPRAKPTLVNLSSEPCERVVGILSHRNHFGILSEDLDAATGELWGNFPQTYSMAGIINSAMRLSRSWEEARCLDL